MVHFILIVAVVATICASENAPPLPVADGLWRLGLAVAGMLLVMAFAHVSSLGLARKIRDNRDQRTALLRRFGRMRTIHASLWLGMAAATLYGLRWAQLVRFNWQMNDVVFVRDLLVLLPVVLPLVASWAAFYEVDRSLYLGKPPSPGCTPGDGMAQALISRSRYLALHARHYLGLVLLPVLTLLALQDLTRLLAPQLATEELSGVLYLPPLILMFALFPLLLSRIWHTEPLVAGPLRARLEACGRRSGFRLRKILVWQTDRAVVNAAVAGFLPCARYVFLTDGLLARFRDDEVEAVFEHEIGHIRHNHLFVRLLVMLLPAGLWVACREACPGSVSEAQRWLADCGLSPMAQAMLFAPAAIGLFGGTIFAMVSRLLELEADLFACRAGDGALTAAAVDRYVAVLEKLAVTTGEGRATRSWLHPSIAERTAFVQRMLADPPALKLFETRRQRLSWLLFAMVAGCSLLLVAK